MRHIPCKLLLAFAFLLFTLPAFGADKGVARTKVEPSRKVEIHSFATATVIPSIKTVAGVSLILNFE